MDSTDLELAENENEANLKNQNQALLQSFLSTHEPEETWKPSSLGIRCFSQKPKGHIFLTRRILDLCSTDGKRKIEIEYNYSKDFQNEKEFKSKGSSIQNCSFCDTVSLDFEPESTFFDLLMDVQIITVAPENFKHLNKIEDYRPPELVSYTDTGQELEVDSDCEESRIYSSYNLRYSKQEPSTDDHEFFQPSEDQLKDDNEILNGNGQKLIIKTLIKNEIENNSYKSLESLNTYENSKLNTDQTNQSYLSNIRSNSSSSLMSSLSDSGSYCQNYLSAGKCSLYNNSSTSDSRSSSRRSIYTTVEFYPPGENHVEMIDLNSDSTYSYEDIFNKNALKDLSNNENKIESKNKTEMDEKEIKRITTLKEKENNEHKLGCKNLEETFKNDEKTENKIFKLDLRNKSNDEASIKMEERENEINLENLLAIETKTKYYEDRINEKAEQLKEKKVKEIEKTTNEEEKINKDKKLILERTIIKKEKEIKIENKNEILITNQDYEKFNKEVKIEHCDLTNGEKILNENKNIENILKKEEDYSLDLLENYNLILNIKKKLHSEKKEKYIFEKDEKNMYEFYLSLNTSKDFVEPINKTDQHEDNESITEDLFELTPKHAFDEKNQQSYFKSLISKFTGNQKEDEPKIQEATNEKNSSEALNNPDVTDLNKTDLNFINRSVYNLVLKEEDENTAYTSLFNPSNDCTYFPLFKIESDKINVELLNRPEIKSENIDQDDLAVFNNEAEWKTDYIDSYPNESIEKTFKDFIEPINKTDQHEDNESITEDLFELIPKHAFDEKNQQSYFKSLISKFTGNQKEDEPKIQEATSEKNSGEEFKKYSSSNYGFFKLLFKKKNNDKQFFNLDSQNTQINFLSSSNDAVFYIFPNDNDFFLSSQTSFINDHNFISFINHFNLKDISSLNFFIQESFFRSSISVHTFNPFSIYNVDSLCLNESQPSQFLQDLYSIQNLRIQKPLFDDFAVFLNTNIEYSKYFLLTSKKFEYINNIERSGQSFFYLEEDQRLNIQPLNQSLFRNAFSFILISVGALTIFSRSFN